MADPLPQRRIGPQAFCDLLRAQPEQQADGRSRQRVEHIVQARHAQCGLKALSEGVDRELAALRRFAHAGGAHVAALGQAEAHGVIPRGQRPQQGVVPVEDHASAGTQALEDLKLGAEDALARAEIFDVHRADVRDHGQVRLRDAREHGQLAEVVHAHLEHGRLAVRLQPQDADRQADLIVIILFRPLRAQCRAQGAAIISFVVVLPTLPVMPTQRHGRLSR